MRSVPEWIAKRDDDAIPPRVRERIAARADDCCQSCRRSIRPPLRAEYDHVVPLILGGQHRETNLQLLCHECHGLKTKRDVKIKAKVARIRKRNLGIRKPSRFPGARNSKFKIKIGGGVVLRTGRKFNSGVRHDRSNDRSQ